MRNSVTRLQSRLQTAVDELAEENAKFKKIEHPSSTRSAAQPARRRQAGRRNQNPRQNCANELDPLLGVRPRRPDESEARDFPVLFCRRLHRSDDSSRDSAPTLASSSSKSTHGQAPRRAALPAGESPAKPTSSAPKRRPETCSPNWKATARTPTKRSSSAPITITWATAASARSPRRPAMRSIPAPTTTPRARPR